MKTSTAQETSKRDIGDVAAVKLNRSERVNSFAHPRAEVQLINQNKHFQRNNMKQVATFLTALTLFACNSNASTGFEYRDKIKENLCPIDVCRANRSDSWKFYCSTFDPFFHRPPDTNMAFVYKTSSCNCPCPVRSYSDYQE